jgi:hypothetical protein
LSTVGFHSPKFFFELVIQNNVLTEDTPQHVLKMNDRIVEIDTCSAPRFAVEIIAVWAVASSLYTVGIVTLYRVVFC